MTGVRFTKRVLPQFATGFPSSDDGWNWSQSLICVRASEGAGQVMGEALIEQHYGLVMQPGAKKFENWGIAPDFNRAGNTKTLTDLFMRLLLEDTAGSMTLNGVGYTPFWWGIVGPRMIQPDGASTMSGGLAQWGCVGLAGLLDRIYINRGYEIDSDGTYVVDPGFCPVFNDLPFGDSTDLTKTVNAQEVFVFDRGAAGTRARWQVRDIVELLLAGYANPSVYSPFYNFGNLKWQLGSGAALLQFDAGRVEADGKTIAQILNELINPRRGLIWRITVAGNVASVNITSTSEAAVTVGPATIPAASPVSITLSGDGWKNDTAIVQDNSAFDQLKITGFWPLVAITLWYRRGDADSSIIPDAWVETDAPSDDPADQKTWRRWKIRPSWKGTNYGKTASGLRSPLASEAGNLTGARAWDGTFQPQSAALRFDRMTPLGDGCTTELDGPRNQPLVLISGGGSADDFSARVSVTVHENPAAITLGDSRDEADLLADFLDDGTNTLLVTLGVYEWAPLAVSWTRAMADWPRDVPRVWTRRVPEATQRLALAGTVFGAPDGVLQVQPTDLMIRDDLPVIQAELALARARFGGSGGANSSFTEAGVIDIGATYAPGQFLGSIVTTNDTFVINAVFVRREWEFDGDAMGTRYSTERTVSDVESRP